MQAPSGLVSHYLRGNGGILGFVAVVEAVYASWVRLSHTVHIANLSLSNLLHLQRVMP
jgi:hypothetical protein